MRFLETVIFVISVQTVVSLRCYRCPSTTSSYLNAANLKCLENVTEVVCQRLEDRCYSLTLGPGNNQIEKGCTTSNRCLGNRICCSNDYCNAGYGLIQQTGVDKRCQNNMDCIQGSVEMTCARVRPVDSTKRCTCVENTYRLGAMCRRLSDVGGVCYSDEHCLPTNSFCHLGTCRCGENFYSNESNCLLKFPLNAPCSEDIQCRSENSECRDERCLCKPNFFNDPHSDQCSGGMSLQLQTVTFWIVVMTTMSALIHTQDLTF